MARWSEIEAAAPDFADRARRLLDAHAHKTLATLRADGSPRISGIETRFHEGDLWFGSMPAARKAADLGRDPRYALHSGSDDPPDWQGDAKVAGRVEEITEPERRAAVLKAVGGGGPSDSHIYRADIDEASVVWHPEGADHLVIEVWTAAAGFRRFERR